MIELEIIYRHSDNVVSRQMGDEYILVPLHKNVGDMDNIYTLKETGAFIWENIDGKQTVNQIIDKITEEFNVGKAIATADILAFLRQIKNFIVKV